MNDKIKMLANSGNGVMLVVSASDLREVVGLMYREAKEEEERALRERSERPTMTRREVMATLGVGPTTMHRWKEAGYLTPVKIGAKCLYRAKDVNAILERGGEGHGEH